MSGGMGGMEGMLWASLVLVGVPLLIGIGLAIVLLRRRGDGRAADPHRGRSG